jgi:hypothetical protein
VRRLLLLAFFLAVLPRGLAAQGALEVTLTTDRTAYPVGAPVALTFTARNRGDAPLILTFPSGQMIDLAIGPPDSPAVVWRWSQGQFFTQALIPRTLAPGEALTFTAAWDQRNQAGLQVPTGVYAVTAVLMAAGRPSAGPVRFVIGEEHPLPGPGCITVRSTFPNGTPVEVVAGAVSPADALLAIWRMEGNGWLGWTRASDAPVNLRGVAFGDRLRLCLAGPARWIAPV